MGTNNEHYLKAELDALVRSSSDVFDFLCEASLDGFWYWDLENPEHEWMSPSFWQLLGFSPDEKPHLVEAWQDLIHPDDLHLAKSNFLRHCADPMHPYDQEVRYRHKNGSTVWVRCRGMAVRDENGTPIRMLGAHNDITRLKEMEACYAHNLAAIDELYNNARQALAESEMLFECSPDAILQADTQGRILKANQQAAHIFGYTVEELLKLDVEDLIPAEFRTKHIDHRAHFAENPSIRPMAKAKSDLLGLKKNGEVFPTEIRLSHIKTNQGANIIASIRDISEQHKMRDSLQQTQAENRVLQIQSNTDPLTQVHNRRFFEDVAAAEFCHSVRHAVPLSVLILDIDHFKKINDSYGHGTGDLVLHTIAQHLNRQIRSEDTFARIGGEEFAILMPSIGRVSAMTLAERIRQSVTTLNYHGSIPEAPTISIGAASLCKHDTGIECMLLRADKALYKAKAEGRNTVCYGTHQALSAARTPE